LTLEREVKLRISHSAFMRALRSAGMTYELKSSTSQEDLYLDFDDCRLMLSDSVLRIRSSGDGVWITYKGPRHFEGGEKVREELEALVGSEECQTILGKLGISERCPKDLERLLGVLNELGIKERVRVRKRRRELRINGMELRVYLDDVEHLGEFVEVEGEGSMKLVRMLGMNCRVVIPSYADLIHAVMGSRDS